jgi:two-component system sensor histidine kinase/response regulator
MRKILVVEDGQSLRKDILEILSFEGYDAVGAENGIVGVQRARETRPDLIICDIMMPILDGFGVLEELRKDPDLATIPFIFLTARTDRSDSRYGMELGADDYLTKPFTASELLATVNARLDKRAKFEAVTEQRLENLRGNIILALPHELRTPLNVILGFSDLLMTDASIMDGVRIADMARHINTAGMRLYRLIENFLTYAQTELMLGDSAKRETLRHGYMVYPKSSVEGHSRAKAMILSRADDVVFEVEDVEAIGITEEYLKKILEELVDNAIKFSESGSPIRITGAPNGTHYEICVSDSGRGLTPEQIASIGAYMQFERRLYEQQGSGLGLVICKRLIDLHGGELIIDSAENQGTTVCVRLPLRSGILTSG